ncbi:MAG: cupin domain-containing protein [Alphaproteobacteria bacterium]|jgi:mannose-6-phosphate isomerase-like protein (cupin superfamily)|nr:cupin domain-containing protein [Alphaproteobacteria bacterium]MBP9776340.1 cupin domain-containing protein [Alphaproteobacteria bacterium]
MTIQYKDIKNPCDGVSLIRSLDVPIAKPFQIDEITILENMSSPVDKHEVAELWSILSGTGDLTYDGKNYILKTGEWFFFEPFKEHQVVNNYREDLRILSIYWKSTKEER